MDWDLLVDSDLEPGVGALPVGAVAPPSKRSGWRGQLWGRRAPRGRRCPPSRTPGTWILDPPAPDGGEGQHGQGTDQAVLGVPLRGVCAGEAAGRCAQAAAKQEVGRAGELQEIASGS